MQGRNKLVTELYDCIRAFEMKLQLFERQLSESNLSHFPTLRSLQGIPEFHADITTKKYCIKKDLLTLNDLRMIFFIFRDPFSVGVNEVPEHLQLELIELQLDSVLKNKFSS
ncbi:general transcription factor II-I repeat domain-containing protein 2-like, partial [Homarus americanus]|uniref:general transcription factor II-I repeat domain-containing protein 2-like n=1 Tax=Homarus americanus TaxID=6706 RepID=UPI001C473B89